MQFNHYSVMLRECIDGLNIKENGIYIDCTLGGGGHTGEILKSLKSGKLISIDQDDYALDYCKEKFKDNKNIVFVKDNFKNIDHIIRSLNIDGVDGILMDLGISSYQIDTDERGFSYMRNGKLDMRMNRDQELSAYNVINEYDEARLNYIFKVYGEEKFHRKIAFNIIKEREIKPIETTFELVNLIDRVVPKYEIKKGGHLSKKVFQALRIEVNGELDILEQAIRDSVKNLNKLGRIVVITFHSLEDRIIKNIFRELSIECVCPKDFPICTCDKVSEIKLITRKPILPSNDELNENSRSRSAKLRIVEKK